METVRLLYMQMFWNSSVGHTIGRTIRTGSQFRHSLKGLRPPKGRAGEPVQSYRKLHTKRIILTRCGFCRETGQIRCRLHPYLPTFCPGFVRATRTCFRHRIATSGWCGHPSGTSRHPKILGNGFTVKTATNSRKTCSASWKWKSSSLTCFLRLFF